jgi:hypothetical protein
MSTPKTVPAGCPDGYNAREQSIWAQCQALYVQTGHLAEKLRKAEELIAWLARDQQELRWVTEHILAHTGCPSPDLAEFADKELSAGKPAVPAAASTAGKPARKKGGA